MAVTINHVLKNVFVKKALNFVASREDGERRTEKILKAYIGEDVDLSIKDKIAYFITKGILEFILSKADISKSKVKNNLSVGYWRKGLASTLEGLAWNGATKPFTSYAPFLVVWNFTNACNLNCKHCYQNADKPTKDELTTDQALKAVDEMADAGVAYIAFSGGEPLFRDDFFEIASHTSKRDLGFAVATNATLLTQEKVERLEDLGCQYIQASLDGKRETHNEMRGSNVYEKTMEGIENAAESDITLGVAMTVVRDNFGEVEDVIDIAEEVGADIFMHYNFIPTGRGKDIVKLDITPQQREELLTLLASESRNREITLLSTAPQYGRVTAKGGSTSMTHFDVVSQESGMGEEIESLAEFVGGCGTGRLYWALQPNGDLIPCVFFPKVLGNIKEDSFLEVWKNSPVLEKMRNRENFAENCGSCDSRNICGGCRARAYAYFNDVQEGDPGCINNKEKWNGISETK